MGVFLVDDVHGVLADARRVRARRSCWISGRRPFARPVFLIVALVTATIARRDAHCATALLGQLLNTVLCVVLKKSIRAARPRERPSAVGFSPHGMPSNHSQFVFFFAAFWCSYLLRNNNNDRAARINEKGEGPLPGHLCHSIVRPAAVVAIPFCATLVSAGRVYLAYHTPAQVIVGALVGSMAGLTWYEITWRCIAPTVFPRLEASYIGRGLGVSGQVVGTDVTWYCVAPLTV